MGSLQNRGTKNAPEWYVVFRDTDGKWKRKHSKQPTKDEARDFLAHVEARIKRGLVGIPELTSAEAARAALTVADLAARFLGDVEGVDGYSTPKIKSLAVYRALARTTLKCRILPTLAKRPATSITLADVKRLRDAQLTAGLKPGSVAQTLATLSRLYTWARSAGLVDCCNPVAGCERLRSAESLDFLDKREAVALLAHVEARALADGATHADRMRWPFVAIAVYCGLRKGELFGLRWPAVNLDAGLLDVLRSYRGLPKSGKVRHVPIHSDLARVLRWWRDRCPRIGESLVCPVEVEADAFRMGSKEDSIGLVEVIVAADCHLPTDGHPIHMLRHTFAAHFMMAGGNLYTLQKLLGHASPQMTQRYAHLAPDFLGAEVARMSFASPTPEGVTDLAAERRRRSSG